MNLETNPIPSTEFPSRLEPNVELLRVAGWSVISTDGLYCSAWKGSQEILVVWQEGRWQKIAGNSGIAR
ncbi:MAG: hypothetical protein ACJ8F7_09855 [Gemmataceae bacterium]